MTGVVLRPVQDGDADRLFAFQADPIAAAMADFPSRDRAEFDAHLARVLADAGNVYLVVEADGEVVGNVASFLRDDVREVGYWIDRGHWGRGIATAAVALLVERDPTRPLHAGVAPHNLGSQRVLERAGFVPHGVDESDGMLLYRLDG